MAKRTDTITYGTDDSDRDSDLALSNTGEALTIQRLAAQVDRLQRQVDTLTSAFSVSIELQRSLLQQLEDQASHCSPRLDTKSHNIFTSTPVASTHPRPSPIIQDVQTSLGSQHSISDMYTTQATNTVHLPGFIPPKFDGDKTLDPEEWLQSVSLYKTTLGLSDSRFFLELMRLFDKEPRKWYCAMQPHLHSWSHFSDLFRQAFLPTDNEEKIWRGILDRVKTSEEPLPTFVTHLVTEFKRLKQPPSEREQIEVICRHVSDQYRLALHATAPTTLTELLLTAHDLHSALGPISSARSAATPPTALPPDLHCYKCLTPGVTTRNCGNCKRNKQSINIESGRGMAGNVPCQDILKTSEGSRGETGARPRTFQRFRGAKQEAESSMRNQQAQDCHTVKLVQKNPGLVKSKNKPLTSMVVVNEVSLKATLDTGASISAVHPSTLEQCEIKEGAVLPWNFSPLELADSKRCTPAGVVWLPVQLLGHLFTHRFAVIPDLSCPILLGTDFMIQADVHIHPATGSVRLGDNASSVPETYPFEEGIPKLTLALSWTRQHCLRLTRRSWRIC
ncbi:Glycerophosphoinositol inositolphosphodiesterase GDPD2 [Clarias magur]|uniref:Glycerophosphoinositol inositolphosphodiesterase GDPD2 n=1 Tax=Clarias magur TaxID=1594786 RepID=A0A8J4TQ54_CLAMG|nr:Glycerophosphoinositol inositolphosphodiesterase GDPD2 [Clarias magur]